MYPTAPDHEKYAGDHDHHILAGHVPAPGLSPHGAARVYAPPYIVSTVRSSRHVGGEWSSGLCHCCDDPANCMITFFCPCITFGQIAEIVDQGSSSCAQQGACYGILLSTTALACLYSCFYRSKLRGQYDLEESPCVDCLVHFCCATCALCQEYRELRSRGFDMGIDTLGSQHGQTKARSYCGSNCYTRHDKIKEIEEKRITIQMACTYTISACTLV